MKLRLAQRLIFVFLIVLMTACTHKPVRNVEVTATPSTTAELVSKYRLDTGDTIRIDVFDEKELSIEATLTDSGTISYPFLGEIFVRNKTIGEIMEHLTKSLKGTYVRDPLVSVNILKYRDFYVDGEVKSPGSYPYKPGLTVRKAVALAGGFTDRASRTKISVIRDSDPAQQETRVDTTTEVYPGDMLIVEESIF